MIITVWPGRVLCVWDDKGQLVARLQMSELEAREHMRALLAGWDEKPICSTWARAVEHGV